MKKSIELLNLNFQKARKAYVLGHGEWAEFISAREAYYTKLVETGVISLKDRPELYTKASYL